MKRLLSKNEEAALKAKISVLLTICIVLSALAALPAAAADRPFTDVTEGTWYYESVIWCRDNGYMTGTSATQFEPDAVMSRAMIVQVLWAAGGKPQPKTDAGFEDVGSDAWYADAVAWAAGEGIVAGVGDGLFLPEAPLTREQFVQILRRYFEYAGVDVSYNGGKAFDAFADGGDASFWAKESLEWAAENDVISGVGTTDGAPRLLPGGTVTRAQAAVFLRAALEKNLGGAYPVGSLTLGGTDISEFTIVYSDDLSSTVKLHENMKQSAEFLADGIKRACGVELPVYKDDELPAVKGAYEILVGITDREAAGLVSVDRAGFRNQAYIYEMKGNYLVLTCPEEKPGAAKAVAQFLEDVCGVTYYGNGLYTCKSIANASIADGVRAAKEASFDNVVNSADGGDDQFLGTLSGDDAMLNLSHSLPVLGCAGCEYGDYPGSDHHIHHYLSSDPCLSDPDVIDTIIANVRKILDNRIGDRKDMHVMVHVSQSDSAKYCRCQHCSDIYRLWGRGATYVQIITYVNDALKDEYPNVTYVGYACDHSAKRPKTADEISDANYAAFLAKYGDLKYVPAKDITPPENSLIFLKTDTMCTSHEMYDEDCELNREYIERAEGWCKVYGTIYFNNFTGSRTCEHNPFPDVMNLPSTYAFFAQYENFKGFRTFAFNSDTDFPGLRTFLIARLAWDANMSDEEYTALIDSYLKAKYGPGWTYLREIIDTEERLSSANHWWTYRLSGDNWDQIISREQWSENGELDRCLALCAKAAELCDTPEQEKAVAATTVPLEYVECRMAYAEYKDSGAEQSRAVFTGLTDALNAKLRSLGLAYIQNWPGTENPDNWVFDTD